ncbi:MAG: hypothetical protein ACXWUG_22080 [Polyangiales bacterium]
MMQTRAIIGGLLAVGVLGACGGGASAPAASAPPAPAAPAAKEGSPAATTPAPDDDEVHPDTKAAVASSKASPTTADGNLLLENLLKPGAPLADFPKATVKDADCSKGIGYTGNAAKDYVELTSKCGAPTGLKEYAKTVSGKLDSKHPRDTYVFKMAGGFCYRFFAVADDTISNLDIRVQRPEGALVSIAASKNFVAIMDPDRVWCKTHDRDFRLVVETSAGQGNYKFGVWARPKDK